MRGGSSRGSDPPRARAASRAAPSPRAGTGAPRRRCGRSRGAGRRGGSARSARSDTSSRAGRGGRRPSRARPCRSARRAGDLRLDVVRERARGRVEHARGRDRPPDALEADAVQQLLAHAASLGRARSASSCRAGGSFVIAAGAVNDGMNAGSPRGRPGWSRFPATIAYGVSGSASSDGAPRLDRIALVRPQAREAEVELDDRDLGIELRELLEPVERAVRPRGERGADLRLERVVLREERRRVARLALLVERRAARQIARLGVRRGSRARSESGGRPSRSSGVVVVDGVPAESPSAESTAHGDDGHRRDRDGRRRGARHDAARTPPDDSQDPKAIVPKVMATYRELLAQVGARSTRSRPSRRTSASRRRTGRCSSTSASPTSGTRAHPRRDLHGPRPARAAHRGPRPRQDAPARRLLLGRIALGLRREGARGARLPERRQPRRRLLRLEAERLRGHDPARPLAEQRSRYSRHLLIPEVGEEGQQRLLDARVLLIGAGGLGSPASLYLAAAGVGTLGIVDADVVDESNLQRQVVHSTDRLGEPKVALGEADARGAQPRRGWSCRSRSG